MPFNWWVIKNLLAGAIIWVLSYTGSLYCVQAQTEVSSNPSGFYRIELLGNSDTIVSLPYLRPEAACGLVVSYTDNVVVVTGSPSWTENQWIYAAGVQTNSYFMLICSGTREGAYYPITANGADSLTLNLSGDTLNDLSAGDRVAIIPYWTLGSIFPNGQAAHASPSKYIRRTEIYIPNYNGTGVNLGSQKMYYFSGGNWLLYLTTPVIGNDDPLLPDAYFVVRHNVATNTTLTLLGSVACSNWRIPLNTLASGKQDNVVALPRPASVSLLDSGLVSSGAFRASTSAYNRTDELYVYDNTVVAKNKSASALYYYYIDHWRRYNYTTNANDALVFTPGSGVVIRKGAFTENPIWLNEPGY